MKSCATGLRVSARVDVPRHEADQSNLELHAIRHHVQNGRRLTAIWHSHHEANASRYHGKAPDEIDWSVPERQTRGCRVPCRA